MTSKAIIWTITGTVFVLFAILCTGLGVMIHRALQPQDITWDLSHGDTIAAVHWPATLSGKFFDQKGEFNVTIIGSAGHIIFHERVQHFICERDGTHLTSATLHFGIGTTFTGEQAYNEAKKIMTDWPFRPENVEYLERWHDGIAKHTPHGEFFILHQHDHDSFDSLVYPSFDTIYAGNVSIRISVVGGAVEDGTCQCVLTLTF